MNVWLNVEPTWLLLSHFGLLFNITKVFGNYELFDNLTLFGFGINLCVDVVEWFVPVFTSWNIGGIITSHAEVIEN